MLKFCFTLIILQQAVRAEIRSITCNNRTPKIVGGLEAERNEMPFIVSLMRRGGHFCGGTIIHERWLLTAGHCICNGLNKFMQPTQIQGVLGLHSISEYTQYNKNPRSSQQEPISLNFKSIVAHPQYKCTSVQNDIALLEFVHPVQFSQLLQPPCLNSDLNEKTFENKLATVAGWGWTQENQESGQRPDKLRKATVKIWNSDICSKSYLLNAKPSSILDSQLCAGYENGGIDSCWADSGGPLVFKDNVLVGVVSTGVGCARPGLPGIYTRVSKYIKWIESVINNS